MDIQHVETVTPTDEQEVNEQHERLDSLQVGDFLDYKPVIQVTHIPKDGVQAPGAIVTRVWRRWDDGSAQYVTHFLNKQSGGCTSGDYTNTLRVAGKNHRSKVERFHPEAVTA